MTRGLAWLCLLGLFAAVLLIVWADNMLWVHSGTPPTAELGLVVGGMIVGVLSLALMLARGGDHD